MKKPKYGIIKEKKLPPVRELLVVPHEGKKLIVSYHEFEEEREETIKKNYSHPKTRETIRFRPASISESISIIHHDFKRIKSKILDHSDVLLGGVMLTEEGVFTNTPETKSSKLKQLLNRAEKVNGIYLRKDGIGFAPYGSFKIGLQDIGDFVEGGLARVLEHASGKVAKKLKEIGSSKFYKKGVFVSGFDYSSFKNTVDSILDEVHSFSVYPEFSNKNISILSRAVICTEYFLTDGESFEIDMDGGRRGKISYFFGVLDKAKR